MNPTIDILRGELERLFTLEEMTSMSERLLGLAPDDVGGASAKGSFAKALTERCFDGDRLDALVDVILHSRKEVDPRVRDYASLMGKEELPVGRQLGDFRQRLYRSQRHRFLPCRPDDAHDFRPGHRRYAHRRRRDLFC